jgi:REP element-mobilizing transposase RayT
VAPPGIRTTARDYANPVDYKHPYPTMAQFADLLALRYDANRTRHSYYRQLRLIHQYFNGDPSTITEAQLREYFLFVKLKKHWKPKSIRQSLAEASRKTHRQVHSYCPMSNHFYLVVETPRANLVDRMKWLLAAYKARFNRKHRIFGHLFSGRYKALPVEGRSTGYLKSARDYVHLNPVRTLAIQHISTFACGNVCQALIDAQGARQRELQAVARPCHAPNPMPTFRYVGR